MEVDYTAGVSARGNRSSDLSYRRIAEELSSAILRGEFKVGDRLPTERELSRRFGVSHLVVREALRILKQQGFIMVRRGHGGGIFVAHPSSRPAQEVLRTLLRTRQIRMEHLTEVRLIYEPKIARLAAERITEAELEQLAHIIARQEEALRRGEQEAFDLQFHRVVAEATRNPVFIFVMDAVVSVLLPEVRRMHLDPASKSHILDFHRRLYEALAARDPERADQVMAEHVAGVQERLTRLHEEQFPEAARRLVGVRDGA